MWSSVWEFINKGVNPCDSRFRTNDVQVIAATLIITDRNMSFNL